MDRRTKGRMEVQLTCCIGAGKASATPVHSFTENVSRTGMLVRWMPEIALPAVNSELTLDIYLPENSDFGTRVMRCRTIVIRVNSANVRRPLVALKISSIRFVPAKLGGGDLAAPEIHDLANMPAATNRVI